MDIFDIIKERFKGKQSLEGIQEDFLWEQISNELDQEEGKAPPLLRSKWPYLALLILLLGMGSLYCWYTDIQPEGLNPSAQAEDSPTQHSPKHSSYEDSEKESKPFTITNSSLSKNVTPLDNSNVSDVPSTTNKDVAVEMGQQTSFTPLSAEHMGKPKTSINETRNEQTLSENANWDTPALIQNESNPELEQAINTVQSPIIEKETTAVAIKEKPNYIPSITQIPYLALNNNPMPVSIQQVNVKTPKEPTLKHWEFGFHIGADLALLKYDQHSQIDGLQEEIDGSHHSELGYQMGFKAQWHHGDQFFLQSGISLIESQTEFFYISESATTMQRPGSSDPTNRVPAIAKRKVLNDNKFRHLSIPLEIGKGFRLNPKWSLGSSAGLGLNYFVGQKGKSVDQDFMIAEFSRHNTHPTPYRNFFLSYQISPYVGYDVSRNVSLQLSPQFRYQQHGSSPLYGLKHHAFGTGLNLNIMYQF